jgi:hypothetical protein
MYDALKDVAAIAPDFTFIVAFAAFLVASVGLVVARRQLILNRKNQRETTAKATFREFLKLCVQHPDLAYGKPPPNKQEEYEWFVAYLLWAAEEILEFSPDDWNKNLHLHLNYHKDFLKNNKRFCDEDYPCYSSAAQSLVDSVRATE